MTDIEQLIRAAADLAPRADNLVGAAHGVARRHQRRRIGGIGVALVATTAVVAIVSQTAGLRLAGGNQVGSGGLPAQCLGGFARPVPVAAIADTVLLSNSSDYTLHDPLLARMDKADCARPPVPIAYRTVKDGAITKAFSVTGPAGADGATYDPAPAPVALRGTTGHLLASQGGGSWLEWAEPDGRVWRLAANGLTRAQMLTIASGLSLGDTATVDPSTVPAGMVSQPGLPTADTAEHPMFYADYSSTAGTFNVVLADWQENTTTEAAGLGRPAHLLTINSHEAVLYEDSAGGHHQSMLSWRQQPGTWVEIQAEGVSAAQLEAFADTLVPVSAEDPRLAPVDTNSPGPAK